MSGLRSRLSTSRRRKAGGGSSREASAESNGSASDFDDTDAASVQNLTLREDPSSLPRQTPANRPSVGLRQRVLSPADDATELETETGDDGDVSSAGLNRPRVNTETATQHPASHYNALPRPRVNQPMQSSSSSVTFGEGDSSGGGGAGPAEGGGEGEGEGEMIPPSPPASAFTRPATERKHSHAPAPSGLMSRVSAAELQESIREAIAGRGGVDGVPRAYKINEPPTDRPVRIYCDGVYDLFHYAHALQLRQAKLSFPNVYLLAGVCADELVAAHKNIPVLKSEERYESVRNCKWVDEVVEDAPWTVTQDFIDKHRIDYIAHDEEPYQSAGSDDIYKFVKDQGKFLPTRRTSGISTSELLQRIVENYRLGDYDELRSHPPSETGSRATRKSESVGTFDSPARISSPTRPGVVEHEHLGVPVTDGIPSHLDA